ncbi:MAG: SDR family NAD(P)-dependent oxidoreductase [Magnetospirillum sp.]|nr:SDR family NAD(P)-dependent oxidoreductase [Magnetospirillum sp.]
MTAPSSVLITGASSGIGEALARAYSRPGATLFLSGRDEARLETVAAACRDLGARVESMAIDVADREAMAAWVTAADARAPLDLVVANAGISAGSGMLGESGDQVRAILATNIDGVVNTVLPALPGMQARGRGQIAIMSSLASFRGMPGAPAYCASKAAVRVWGEGLRGWLAPSGIHVSVICPGFVTTRMTADNRFPMPFLMDGGRAARIVIRSLARNRGRIAFPFVMLALVRLFAALPDALADRISRRMPRKP